MKQPAEWAHETFQNSVVAWACRGPVSAEEVEQFADAVIKAHLLIQSSVPVYMPVQHARI